MLGSVTEDLVNGAIRWYFDRRMAYFRKSYVPSVIINKYTKSDRSIRLCDRGDVDYYGVYLGKYVAFEAKETAKDSFRLSQIRPHQMEMLVRIRESGGLAFLMLNFISHTDCCHLIGVEELERMAAEGRRRIDPDEARRIGAHVPIAFPGILDFLEPIRRLVPDADPPRSGS